jgi:hypothetical protein
MASFQIKTGSLSPFLKNMMIDLSSTSEMIFVLLQKHLMNSGRDSPFFWMTLARSQLSVPYRPGTPTYKLQVKTRSGACIRAPPPCSTGPCLLAKVAPDPTSLLGRAPAFPRVSRLRTPPSGRALVPPHVLRHRTPPPCSGGLRRCHVSRGSLWSTNLKNKERLSWPTYAARLVCFQVMPTRYQNT